MIGASLTLHDAGCRSLDVYGTDPLPLLTASALKKFVYLYVIYILG